MRKPGGMADLGDPKAALHHYFQATRDDLVRKLDGLSERQARLPRTATGNNVLGVLKQCLNVEAGYLGPKFAYLSNSSGCRLPVIARHRA
jgi:hypothetical protein